MARPPSLLSDSLLRQLMAAGQTDVVIGIPTLNNAGTIEPVLAAIHDAVAGSLHRVLILNSDGGSDDGTPDLVAGAAPRRAATVLASHSLRTIHRILAPYHGLPGKQTAIRTLFAAADLLQARALVVADPRGSAPPADVYRTLLAQVLEGQADFIAPSPRRDARDRPLVSQVIRPLLVAAFGRSFDDPTGEDFAASPAFVTDALAAPAWNSEPLRAGIDIWLRVHALAGAFQAMQISTPPRARSAAPAQNPLREVVQQILTAVWTCLDLYAASWPAAPSSTPLTTLRMDGGTPVVPAWDIDDMARAFRGAARDLQPVWRRILPTAVLGQITAGASSEPPRVPDEAWAEALVSFSVAWRARQVRVDDLSASFLPLYQGRAATVLREARDLSPDDAERRLGVGEQLVRQHRDRLATAWTGRPQEGM